MTDQTPFDDTHSDNQTGASRIALIGAAAIAAVSIGYSVLNTEPQTSVESTASDGAQAQADPAQQIMQAIPQLEARLEANPEDEEGWAILGLAYAEAGRQTDAARAFGSAAALNPDEARYHSAQGEALAIAAGDNFPESARQAFARALALDPSDPRARYFEGVRKDMAGDSAGALADWTALLRDSPPDAPWAGELRRRIADIAQRENTDG